MNDHHFAGVSNMTEREAREAVARNYVPEGERFPCGDAIAVLSFRDRIALIEAGALLIHRVRGEIAHLRDTVLGLSSCEHTPDWPCELCAEAVDALITAVAAVEYERGRRAERERLVQIVEGMRLTGPKNVGRCTSKCGDGPCSHTAADFHNAALDALLAKLREAK